MIRRQRGTYESEMFFDIEIILTPVRTINLDTGLIINAADVGKYPNIKDEILKSTTYSLKKVNISSIPIMVKSELCNLHGKSAIELKDVY